MFRLITISFFFLKMKQYRSHPKKKLEDDKVPTFKKHFKSNFFSDVSLISCSR